MYKNFNCNLRSLSLRCDPDNKLFLTDQVDRVCVLLKSKWQSNSINELTFHLADVVFNTTSEIVR